MNAPNIFGTSPNVTLAQLGMQPVPLSFSQWMPGVFAPVGTDGCPDPAKNAMGCYQYINNLRGIIQGAANQKPLIRLADSNLNVLTELNNEVSCSVEELMADSGQATVVLLYEHWIEDYIVNGVSINQDLHLLIDPIPTYPTVGGVPQDWQIRWGGKIKEISINNHEDGTSSIDILAVSHREHTKHLLYGAAPWFAPEVQLPRMWVLPGPLRSILFATGFVNLARLFVPGLSFITNVFNPASWINPLNPDALLNINPLSWPIQCAFVDPVLDTSMFSVLAATWTDWHSTNADLLSDAGCICRAYTWLTTDATSPHTELTDLITAGGSVITDLLGALGLGGADKLANLAEGALENLTRPTRNCVVISYEDSSGPVGPTGTALDGLLELVGVTLDDMITSVLFDQQSQTMINGEEVIDVNQVTPFFEGLLGIQIPQPKVIWRDGQFTGMVAKEVNLHKAPPVTMMVGGRSPSLVNQLQTFGIKYALSEMSMVPTLLVGYGGEPAYIPNTFNQQVPATPGLDSLYQGQLDNVLFAWERFTDPLRALWTGEVAYQEYIERGSTSAYTLAGWLSLGQAHWKTRAFYGLVTKAMNGRPWVYGIDYRLGDRVGFEQDGIIYVDQLAAIKWQYDRKQPLFLYASVGDDRDKRDPIASGMRILQGVYTLVGAFLGEGTIFG